MKLLTKEILKKLPKLYATENEKDKKIVCKFFTPDSNWTWYVIEGQKEGHDYRFFGLVDGFEREYGYFMLSELESIRGALGLPVKRDISFQNVPLSSVTYEKGEII